MSPQASPGLPGYQYPSKVTHAPTEHFQEYEGTHTCPQTASVLGAEGGGQGPPRVLAPSAVHQDSRCGAAGGKWSQWGTHHTLVLSRASQPSPIIPRRDGYICVAHGVKGKDQNQGRGQPRHLQGHPIRSCHSPQSGETLLRGRTWP